MAPINKEETIMIGVKQYSTTQKLFNSVKPSSKAYVSSKIVDALVKIRQHTEELGLKRFT